MGLFDGTPLERPVLCERCNLDMKECECPPIVASETPVPPEKQRIQLRLEKRKRGKFMTVVCGLTGTAGQSRDLLTTLKNVCGAGGTISEGNIEIQGKHLDTIRDCLTKIGFRVR